MSLKLLEVFSKCKQLKSFEINGILFDLEATIDFVQSIALKQLERIS